MVRRNLTRGVLAAVAAGALISAGSATAASAAASAPRPGTIETIAGGPGGPAPESSVSVQPCGVKFARGGLYIGSTTPPQFAAAADFPAVYRVNLNGSQLTPVTGAGADAGLNLDGDPASDASVNACDMTVDSAGNLLLADQNAIRVIAAKTGTYYREKMIGGRIYTLPGRYGPAGDGYTADVELDPAGNVVIVSLGNAPVTSRPPSGEIGGQVDVLAERNGTFYGQKMTAGHRYTIAGAGGSSAGDGIRAISAYLGYALGTVRIDSAGNLLLADMAQPYGSGETPPPPSIRVVPNKTGTYYGQHMKAGYLYTIAGGGTATGDGGPATKAALTEAAAVALDGAGNVLIADSDRVLVLAKKTGTFYGQKMTEGDIYTIAGSGASGSLTVGVPARKAVIESNGIAVDSAGNVLVADQTDSRVLMIAARSGTYYGTKARAGYLYSVAGNGRVHDSGDGGPAKSAELSPAGVADDLPDDLTVISDQHADVVRVVAGRTGRFFAQDMIAGRVYTLAGNRDTVGATYSGDGGSARKAALGFPAGVTADPAGNVLLADYQNCRVRLVAARTGTYAGQRMTAGDIYTIAGDGSLTYSGDGGPARDAGLGLVTGVTSDRTGNVLLSAGQLYPVPDQGQRVRMVAVTAGTYFGQRMTVGDIYTVAGDGTTGYSGDGGLATAAEINPYAITVDNAGNLVLVDGSRVRVVAVRTGSYYGQRMTVGDIYTVAGGGSQTGNGVPAAKAAIQAFSVAVDPAGNVLAGGPNVVQLVAEKTGTYYGKTVRAGDIYTVAGSDQAPSAGDGGPATNAAFTARAIAVGPGGLLLIADSLFLRVRSVAR
jgi:hypothetical protein